MSREGRALPLVFSGDGDQMVVNRALSEGEAVYQVRLETITAPRSTPAPSQTATGDSTFTIDGLIDSESFLVVHGSEH